MMPLKVELQEDPDAEEAVSPVAPISWGERQGHEQDEDSEEDVDEMMLARQANQTLSSSFFITCSTINLSGKKKLFNKLLGLH